MWTIQTKHISLLEPLTHTQTASNKGFTTIPRPCSSRLLFNFSLSLCKTNIVLVEQICLEKCKSQRTAPLDLWEERGVVEDVGGAVWWILGGRGPSDIRTKKVATRTEPPREFKHHNNDRGEILLLFTSLVILGKSNQLTISKFCGIF